VISGFHPHPESRNGGVIHMDMIRGTVPRAGTVRHRFADHTLRAP